MERFLKFWTSPTRENTKKPQLITLLASIVSDCLSFVPYANNNNNNNNIMISRIVKLRVRARTGIL